MSIGTQFKSHELTKAQTLYTLDPYQYSVTKFNYSLTPNGEEILKNKNNKIDGLRYKDADFNKLLPVYTSTKRSVNDFSAQSYHRFNANDGYFNPTPGKDLWYYGAEAFLGPSLNVQDPQKIIFPEPQRGGLNSRQVTRYSTVSSVPAKNTGTWESENSQKVNNEINCQFFNYNSNLQVPFDKVYSFDSIYCRAINIAGPESGSMPFFR
jgi:hypothetical protein